MDIEVTDALVSWCDRKGLRGETAGTVDPHGIGDGASAGKSAQLRQSADQGGGNQPMGKKRPGAATDRRAQQVPAEGGDVMHGGGVQEMNLRQYAQRKTRNGAHWLKLIVSR